MTKIKICGLKTLNDALAAACAGADMLGFHLSKRSPYYVDRDEAVQICAAVRKELGNKCPLLVGVFANELVSNISAVSSKVGLDAAQLDGHESDAILKELRGIGFKKIEPMNKAMAVDDVKYYSPHFPTNERLPSLMLDIHYPGTVGQDTGTDIALAIRADARRLQITGGLTPENVAGYIKAIQPWGIDVIEGVEKGGKPGVKDAAKMKAFIDAVTSASA